MKLPELNELATAKDITEEFKGYNHNLRNSTGEWYDEKNMTTDYYPVASPRDKRSVQQIAKNYEFPLDIKGGLKDQILGMTYTDKQLILLQPIINNNETVGAWLTNNGTLAGINNNNIGVWINGFHDEFSTAFGSTNGKDYDVILKIGNQDISINNIIYFNSHVLLNNKDDVYVMNDNFPAVYCRMLINGIEDKSQNILSGKRYMAYMTTDSKRHCLFWMDDINIDNITFPLLCILHKDNRANVLHICDEQHKGNGDNVTVGDATYKVEFTQADIDSAVKIENINEFYEYINKNAVDILNLDKCKKVSNSLTIKNYDFYRDSKILNVLDSLIGKKVSIYVKNDTSVYGDKKLYINNLTFKGYSIQNNILSFYINDLGELKNISSFYGLDQRLQTYPNVAWLTYGVNIYNNADEASKYKDIVDVRGKYYLNADEGSDRVNDIKRSIVRMGSYIGVFPDGVIYETNNKEAEVPIFNINQSENITDVTFETVITDKDSDIGYSTIYNFEVENVTDNTKAEKEAEDEEAEEAEKKFRISDGTVQYYINGSNMWVNQQTYVKITAAAGAFDNFSVGDSLSLDYTSTDAPGEGENADLTAIYGILSWNAQECKYDTINAKIITKGIENDKEYIITNGFVAYKYVSAGTKISGMFDANAAVTFTRKYPDVSFACESQNRIWCCSKDGHEIYASALGNPYNYYDYSGISTDSYAVNVGTDGAFTGCINFLGHPIFFKDNAMHYISGSYPSNGGEMDGMSYAVTTTTEFKGVEKGSEKSLAIIDNILYYKSAAGIVAYDGANTVVVSSALGKEKYKNAVAGAYKNKYYVSMQDKQGVYHLFSYDTSYGMWNKEDDIQVLQFINVNNELLFSTTDNKIYSISEDDVLETSDYSVEDDFDWECETGNYGYSYANNKYLSRLQVRMQIFDGAKAAIYIQYNSDGVWHRKGEISGKGTKTHLFPIVPIRCDHMKIKIAGHGDIKIYSIAKILEEGGDV